MKYTIIETNKDGKEWWHGRFPVDISFKDLMSTVKALRNNPDINEKLEVWLVTNNDRKKELCAT